MILRPWRESDLPLFSEINADAQVMQYYEKTLTRNESDALAKKIQSDYAGKNYGFWAVEAPGLADFIGYIGLNYWNLEMHFAPCIDIGWRLGVSYWGRGFATEGACACLQYGFETLGLAEIVSMATIENMRSRHVMERLEMKRDPNEDFHHPKLLPDHPLSLRVLYRLSRDEWLRSNKTLNT